MVAGLVGGAGLAGCGLGTRPKAPPFSGVVRFLHGVAAASPSADGAVIWTRLTTPATGPVPLRWVVARNSTLTRVVATDLVETGVERDHTVSVSVTGLHPGVRYYYGFLAGDSESPVGQLRLPGPRDRALKLAVLSLEGDIQGVRRTAAALTASDQPVPDLIVHVGTYAEATVGAALGQSALREAYGLLRMDPAIQALHARALWLLAPPAPSRLALPAERVALAEQVRREWLPHGPADVQLTELALGPLGRVLSAGVGPDRSPPLDLDRALRPIEAWWDFASPFAPTPVPDGIAPPPTARRAPVPFDLSATPPRRVLDWSVAAAIDPRRPPPGLGFLPDMDAFRREVLADPGRTPLGATIEAALVNALGQSPGPWTIVLTPFDLAAKVAPDLTGWGEPQLAALRPYAPAIVSHAIATRFRLPWRMDGFDPAPASRERLLAAMAARPGGVIGLAAGPGELGRLDGPQGDPLGAALAVSAAGARPSPSEGLVKFGLDWADTMRTANPSLTFIDERLVGFWWLQLTANRAVLEAMAVAPDAGLPRRVASYEVALDQGRPLPLRPSSAPQ